MNKQKLHAAIDSLGSSASKVTNGMREQLKYDDALKVVDASEKMNGALIDALHVVIDHTHEWNARESHEIFARVQSFTNVSRVMTEIAEFVEASCETEEYARSKQ